MTESEQLWQVDLGNMKGIARNLFTSTKALKDTWHRG